MTHKEIKVLLKDLFETGDVIGGVYNDEKHIYVFRTTKELQKIGDDDRYNAPGRRTIIRIEKKTNIYKEIPRIFFPTELLPKEPVPTLDNITKGIKKRQFINEWDFLYVVQIFYGEIENPDFNFGKIFYDDKYEREIIRAHFKSIEIQDKLVKFLNRINIKSFVNEKGYLIITRIPEK